MTDGPAPTPYADDSRWFRRYRFAPDDAAEVQDEVERLRAALARTMTPSDELATRIDLGSGLFPLGHEVEAVAVLEPALALAERLGDHQRLIDVQLNLGTALQYLDRRTEALALFDAGLAGVRATGADEQEHYLLHHRGRCLAEVGDVEGARASFERALDLRLALGVEWLITSTRTALAELDAWCSARRTTTPDEPVADT